MHTTCLPICLLIALASIFLVSPARLFSADMRAGRTRRTPNRPRLKKAGFPLVDFHIHLKGGLTIGEAVEMSRRNGIKYGIAANCG